MLKGDYTRAGSLREAVDICRRSLAAEGREDYARLIDEERVRAAIKVALESHKHALEKQVLAYGPEYPWARDKEVEKKIRHFEEVVKPVYLGIAESGSWPAGSSFVYYLFRVDDNLVRYECLNLSLYILTPGTMFQGFAIPIINLYYGGTPPRSEDDE